MDYRAISGFKIVFTHSVVGFVPLETLLVGHTSLGKTENIFYLV